MLHPVDLIVTDMDGTLLGQDVTAIAEENAAALRIAAAQGIRLAICSGRPPDDAGFFALDAGLPMAIVGLNGGCALEKPFGEPLWNDFMPAALAERLNALLLESGLTYAFFGENRISIRTGRSGPMDELSWGTFLRRSGGRCVLRSGEAGLQEGISAGVSKAVVIDEVYDGALERLHAKLTRELPELSITSSWKNNLEINAPGLDKGAGLRRLADRLGIPLSRVMALGDHDNDIPMLKAAGIGVAMGNASPAALMAADAVTVSAQQNGVARAVRAIALGEETEGVRWLR